MGADDVRPHKNRLRAAGLALLTFFGSLLFTIFALVAVLTLFYSWGHPHDRSTGDSAAWALVILSPLLAPVLLYLAGFLARRTYRRGMDNSSAE